MKKTFEKLAICYAYPATSINTSPSTIAITSYAGTIQKISEGTFNTVLKKGGADQFSHGFHFYLINPEGEIVKRYDGTSNAELQVLIEDITTVL